MDLYSQFNAFMFKPLEYPLVLTPIVFIFGAMVGSLLNVCIYRMPLEKSLWWPGSRCGNCYQPVRKMDNLPLLSYWFLKGKCRTCGVKFSSRYFWIELFTATTFALTFYCYMENRFLLIDAFKAVPRSAILGMWAYHMTFICFLIVASMTDFDMREIPLRLTIPGTMIGIIGGSFVGWPWPLTINDPAVQNNFVGGLHYWPFWAPLEDVWLPFIGSPQPGAWYVGFLTSIIGALAGTGLIRVVRALFSWAFEREAMGLGDADLLMMIGAFLGWQALIPVFGWAIVLGLIYALILFLVNSSSELAFGPPLAGGAVLVLFNCLWVHDFMKSYFFNSLYVAGAVFFFVFLCFNACMVIRFLRVGFRQVQRGA